MSVRSDRGLSCRPLVAAAAAVAGAGLTLSAPSAALMAAPEAHAAPLIPAPIMIRSYSESTFTKSSDATVKCHIMRLVKPASPSDVRWWLCPTVTSTS